MTAPTPAFLRAVQLSPAAAVLGLALVACSPAMPDESLAGADIATSTGQRVTLHVDGEGAGAMIRTLAVTSDGKETGGGLAKQSLPYTGTFTIPADVALTKVFVLAEYSPGSDEDISCAISVDGKVDVEDESDDRQPVECLFTPRQ